MTDEEYISNIRKIGTDELFQQLESFGYDPYYGDLWVAVVDELKRRIEERPQGEWIFIDNEVGWDVCSNCNWTDARCHTWRYCPNCGAYMRGEENE